MRRSCAGLAICVACSMLVATAVAAADAPAESARLNVLFIAVDDLRPALGCYGDSVAITPNIDQLASRGIVFERAYCQQAVCAPSRLSLLSGRRPDTIRVWDLATHFREALPDIVSLPQHFRESGYHTQSIGKIYHGNGTAAKDPPSWSVEPRFDTESGSQLKYRDPANLAVTGKKRASYEMPEVDDDSYVDGKVCAAAEAALTELAGDAQPWFLAVGFRKPHLPFCAPKKYWDLYDAAEIPLPATSQPPAGSPELAWRSWQELEGYKDIDGHARLSEQKIRALRHGYYACVSYTDALVGRVLARLDELKLSGQTVVVLWGDHGFQIGEHAMWTKANNFELATRVPLIVSVPRQASAGSKSTALVELVDLYPTLVDVCGLSTPEGLEGISLKPLIEQPNRAWKRAAFSQYPRDARANRHTKHGDVMGYAVRTDRFRYVEWRDWATKRVVARELYDYEADPLETRNLADSADHAGVGAEMTDLLAGGWRAAAPTEP